VTSKLLNEFLYKSTEVEQSKPGACRPLFELSRHQEVAYQAVKPLGIDKHRIEKALHLVWWRIAQPDSLQVQADGGKRGFQLMGYLGDKGLLLGIKS